MRRYLFPIVASLLAVLLFLSAECLADINVDIQLDPERGTVEDIFELSITISGAEAQVVTEPEFEHENRFTIASTGRSQRHTLLNGSLSSEVIFSYDVTPDASLTPGAYQLPRGQFRLNGETVFLKPKAVTILKRSAQQETSPIDFVHIVSNTSPFIGEQVTYSAEIVATSDMIDGSLTEQDIVGMWRESYDNQTEVIRHIPGSSDRRFTIREAYYPLQTGEISIPARTLTASIRKIEKSQRSQRSGVLSGMFDWSPFGSMNYRTISRRFVADSFKINVRPLPSLPPGAQSYIPVGDIGIRTVLEQKKLKQGESATLSISIFGDGNLRPLELPQPTSGDIQAFKTYEDKPSVRKLIEHDRIKQVKVFKIALVPQNAGNIAVPRYSLVTFNPKTERFTELSTDPLFLQVIPDPTFQAQSSTAKLELPRDADLAETPEPIDANSEDIRPQHLGAKTLIAPKRIPTAAYIFSFILLPLVALMSLLLSQRSRRATGRSHDSGLLIARETLLATIRKIPASSDLPAWIETLHNVFQEYLRQTLDIQAKTVSADRARSELFQLTNNEALATNGAKLLNTLERTRFSGSLSTTSNEALHKIAEELTQFDKTLQHLIKEKKPGSEETQQHVL